MSISDQIVTYNRCVVALNGHLMIRNGPTIGVWWKCMPISDQIVTYNVCICTKCSSYDQKWTYNGCGGNACPFLTKLVTYNRCVVALNGHLMIRNGPTIGVWWKCMSISDLIGHLQ